MPELEALTRSIGVRVESHYHSERSRPADKHWFFSYTVRIANEEPQTVRLLSRHWVITDAEGEVQEVRGPGVVGEQPQLSPGQSFEYTSFCPRPTSFGTMHGLYQMITDAGETFDAEIAPFALGEPYSIN